MAGGGGQNAAKTEAAGPVVICCAADDQGAIGIVAKELEQAGHSVEIVSGAESDPKQLADAIDHCHGEGLYVLCRSRALGRDAVDALREILLAKHVPFGRTLTVASTRQRELRDRILASLKRVAAGRVRRMSSIPPEGRRAKPTATPTAPAETATPAKKPKAKRKPKATRLGLPVQTPKSEPQSKAPAAPAAASNPKTRRRPTQLGMMVPVPKPVEASKSRPLSQRSASAPPVLRTTAPPATEIQSEADDPEDAALSGAPDIVALSASGELDANDTFEDDGVTNAQIPRPPTPEPAHLESDGPRAAEESVARAAPISAEELADLDITNPKRKLDGLVTGGGVEDVPVRSGNTSISRVLIPPPPPPVRSGSTVVVQEGMIAGKQLDLSAIPESYVTAGPPLPSGSSLRDAGHLPPAPTTPAPLGGSTVPSPALTTDLSEGAAVRSGTTPRPKWILPVGLAIAATLGAIVVAIVAGGDGDSDGDEQGTVATASTAKDKVDTSDNADDKDSVDRQQDDEPAPVAGERTLVGEALKRRSILALDVLLISAEPTPALPFADAQAHCDGLDVDGVAGWRLPQMGELMSLSQAGMLGRGYYWSSTPADTFGDAHLVWYGRRDRVVTRSQDNYAVCVRQSGG